MVVTESLVYSYSCQDFFVTCKLLAWLLLFLFNIENYIRSVMTAYFFSMYNIVTDNAIGYYTNDMIDQCFWLPCCFCYVLT